ncbi:MAG TPA: DNA N-6-adenine-methyltransferase [Caldisericia bacterium]|nr:DNA N-6-adenine-methyltransferase [Caldisericia bacterium]
MKNRNLEHSDNWKTPDWLYQKLDNEFHFDFDPCPLNHDMSWDGLEVEWGGSNYVNPPYSRKLKESFIRKAIEESKKGKLCVMLLPVSTSTAIFHDWIQPYAKEIRFLRGRVAFEGYNTRGEFVNNKKPMHDSMLVIFDRRSKG